MHANERLTGAIHDQSTTALPYGTYLVGHTKAALYMTITFT